MVRTPPDNWDRSVDVVVVGSGTGMTAALRAQSKGAQTLVLEKSPKIGGTTAVSGGGLWVPNSPLNIEHRDEPPAREKIETYMREVAGERVNDEMITTFLDKGPDAVDFVEEETPIEWQLTMAPDYHPEWEGGDPDRKRLEPSLFDGNILGDKLDDVRENPHFPVPVTHYEVSQHGGSGIYMLEADWEELAERMEQNMLGVGHALAAGLYKGCLDKGVEFETNAPAQELVMADDAVVGVVADIDGEEKLIGTDAVVISSGGIEWDEEMCENFLPGPMDAPASPPYNEGDGIKMGMDVGAKLGNMNEAWWFPVSHVGGEEWEDGSPLYRMNYERSYPHTVMINADGERFVNEAMNYNDMARVYHHFSPQQYRFKNVPSYLVMDDDYRQNYQIMTLMPEDDDPSWVVSADSLEELAEKLGVDGETLVQTVEEFNEHAREHDDPEFGRGQSAHDRHRGDPRADHPNLGPVEEPPFYAIEVHAGALGTKGGLYTQPNAQVLDVWEEPIEGLYATGNGTAHVMGMGYTGGGGTLGPNVTFAYIAGGEAADDAS